MRGWKAFGLTYVVHEDSLPGIIAAVLSLVPQTAAVVLATLIVVHREIELVFLGVGLVCSTVLNDVLKRVIQQPRPLASIRGGYGMPSDHAQFMFCLSFYLILLLRYRIRIPKYEKALLGCFLFILSSSVGWSRVALYVHSPLQVCIGAVIGIVFGVLWYCLTVWIFRPLYPDLLDLSLSRWLTLRDSGSITSAMQYDYAVYRSLMANKKND